MATLSKGYTFGATEQVTAAKLHTLVDSATISGIVAADITSGTITDTQISSVSGAKFTTLSATPSGAGAIPSANLTSVLTTLYPVGSIYCSTVSTNPNTLFGFGTWVAFGAGRVLVGNGTSDAAYAAGATGGVSTVTLTAAQSGLPAHTHPIKYATPSGSDGAGFDDAAGSGTKNSDANSAADASEAHTNLQPYIVVYMFNRTA